MNIFGKVGRWFRRALSTATNPESWFVSWIRGGQEPTASGVSVTEDSALNYSAVWAATRRISEPVAAMPLLLYERLPTNGKRRAEEHRIYGLLHDEPNQEMDAMTFWSTIMPDVLNWGYGVAEKEFEGNGRQLRALWPIPAWRATPKRAKNAAEPGGRVKANELYFEMRDDQGMPAEPLPFSLALVIPGCMPSADGIGKGIIRQARESIGMGLATERFGGQFFGNGARPGGFLTLPEGKSLSEEAKNRLEESFNRKFQNKPHSVALLRDGITYSPSFIPPEDAQFLQTRQHNITEIARWYNLPPHLLADLSRATFSNIDSEVLSFVTYSLLPWFVKIEQACTRQLLSPSDRKRYFLEFLIDSLLRGDTKARAEARQIEFMNGALTIDEWRAGENRNPIPDSMGEEHFVPANLIPLKRALEEPKEEPPPAQVPPDEEDEPPTKEEPAVEEENSIAAHYAALFEESRQEREKWRKAREEASRKAVVSAMARLVTKEQNAVKRAANNPSKFLPSIETFYAGHKILMEEALLPLVENHLIASERLDDPVAYTATVVDGYLARSREDLLMAAECQADELPARVAACVEDWTERRNLLTGV